MTALAYSFPSRRGFPRLSSLSSAIIILSLIFIFSPGIGAEGEPTAMIAISAPTPEVLPAPFAGRSELGEGDIEASGAATVAEAMAGIPGLAASASGSAGALVSVSIRGSTSNQVLVIIDGAPAADPALGMTDFSKLGLAAADIASIEVLRGGASAAYGADAVGGVILITTKKNGGSTGSILDLEVTNRLRPPFASLVGSGLSAVAKAPDFLALLDGQTLSLRLALASGLSVSFGGERAANDFLYVDANGQRRGRENAGLISGRVGLAWQGGAGGGRVDTSLAGSYRELGVSGPIDAPTPDALERDAQLRFALAFDTDSFVSDRVALKASTFALASNTFYRATAADSGDSNTASRGGFDLRTSILLGEKDTLGTGLSFRYDRLDSSNVRSLRGGSPERLSAGLYLEPLLAFAGWTFSPAARMDYTSDFASGLSFSFGAARDLVKGLGLSTNASSSYRAPSFDDLYWPAASGAAGNSSLKPETAYAGDFGLRYGDAASSVSATAYARYARDVILWQPGADGIWRPSNFGAALYPGLELESALKLSPAASLSLGYTFLHSYLLSDSFSVADDRRVPMVPEHAFTFSIEYAASPLKGRISALYTGLRYLATSNVAYDPGHLVVGAHLALEIGVSSSLEFDADNLLDERYESVQGYPMPGFSLRISYKLRLGAGK